MPGDNPRLLMALPCGKTGDSIASPIGRGKSHIETHVSILRNLITTTRHAGHWQTNLHSIGVDVGVLLLPSSRSSVSASARYIRQRCADTINLRTLNSIPRNKITPGPLFKKVNNGSGVSWLKSCVARYYAPATSAFGAGADSPFSASALFTRSTA